jgi:hypothetical protein
MVPKYNFKLFNSKLKLLDESIYEGDFEKGREIFDYMKFKLKTSNPSNEIKAYRKILAEKGYKLVKEAHKQKEKGYNAKNAELIKYYGEQSTEKEILSGSHKPSGLEKAITVISLGAMVLGIVIGYPAITGDLIANVAKGSVGYGAALFFLGLLGVFIANKK